MLSLRSPALPLALAATSWCGSLAAQEAPAAPGTTSAPDTPAEPSSPPSPSAPAEPSPDEPPPVPELRTGARPVPDYDGRGTAHDRDGSPLLWVPRVVLFPLYVVSEYVVRRPLGWATVQAERHNLANLLVDWFTFGPDRQAGIVPTALIDFGFQPSVGLYFFWDRAFADPNQIRVHAAMWGTDWLRLTVTDRVELAPKTKLAFRAVGSRRPDWLYYGLGPRSRSDDEARYTAASWDGEITLDREGWRSSHFKSYLGIRHVAFEGSGCCDEPSLTRQVARGVYPEPPGFEGYTILRQGIIAEFDTREPAPSPGHGVRIAAMVEQAGRTDGDEPRTWLRYGGRIGGFLDLDEHNRVVELSVGAAFADPLTGDGEIPFTEQVTLGGSKPLRGFVENRLVDRSAIAARLDYQWPVWTFLDGTINAEAGNVFGEHLKGFEPGLIRLSFGLGLRTSGRRDHPFEFLIGTATRPIDEGAGLDSFRLVFGATNGF
jgi:hypothetical protein